MQKSHLKKKTHLIFYIFPQTINFQTEFVKNVTSLFNNHDYGHTTAKFCSHLMSVYQFIRHTRKFFFMSHPSPSVKVIKRSSSTFPKTRILFVKNMSGLGQKRFQLTAKSVWGGGGGGLRRGGNQLKI